MQLPMDEQKTLNEQLEAFRRQNPHIFEAMRALNMTLEEYLRVLATMTPKSGTSTNSTFGG